LRWWRSRNARVGPAPNPAQAAERNRKKENEENARLCPRVFRLPDRNPSKTQNRASAGGGLVVETARMTASAPASARIFRRTYATPAGFDDLAMESDGGVLTALHFVSGKRPAPSGGADDLPVFRETRRWLDRYFSGRDPGPPPPFRLPGATPFREAVAREMLAIPFGETAGYGEIAAAVAEKRGLRKMSAQAVGQAVGWNPVCLVVPCHRVIGADGSLTGYGGGLDNKAALLRLERRGKEAGTCFKRSRP
jgi:methylated-DNA-[protein]-cysteine S-methyltransferase